MSSMTLAQQIITIGMCILGTMATRYLPFFIFKENKNAVMILRSLFVLAILIGSLLSADTIWTMGDIANAFMAWINVVALIILGNLGIRIFKDYDKQKKSGVENPQFDPQKLGLGKECETWDK